MVRIFCENTNEEILVEEGTTLMEIKEKVILSLKHEVLGAHVNNKLKELSYKVYNPKRVKFIDITSYLGHRMYVSSLSMLMCKASFDVYPDVDVKIEHSTTNGLYCSVEHLLDDKETAIAKVKKRMKELIKADIPIRSELLPTEEAINIFSNKKFKGRFSDTIDLIRNLNRLYTKINFIEDTPALFHAKQVPSTGYLKTFDLKWFAEDNGVLLKHPKSSSPTVLTESDITYSKLFGIYREHKRWLDVMEIPYVSKLNDLIRKGQANQVIQISEALHEKKVLEIVNRIDQNYKETNPKKLVLISGPSASGKTTTCRRLSVQLSVLGYKPQQISLDNYFVNRVDTPRDANGDYDFENLYALDLELFNDNLVDLLAGKEIEIPKFDFKSGTRYYDGERLKLTSEKSIIMIEGIHGLNPKLTRKVKESLKYKIFVSPITQISIDKYNIMHSSDCRLIRRMVRDHQFRNYSACETIKRWRSVREGELKYIFPYQEEADVMLNSSLMYEICVLRKYAESLLRMVPDNIPEYAAASRLVSFLSIFASIADTEVPPTSIMREFLGGSSFVY